MQFERLIRTSVIAMVVIAVATLALHRTYAQSKQATASKIYFKINPKTRNFNGLTASGAQYLEQQIAALRKWDISLGRQLRRMGPATDAVMMACMTKKNAVLFGGGGGAKSKLAKAFLSAEPEQSFQLTFNQMTPEMALIGGQSYEDARAGKYWINVMGSLAGSKSRLALLNEIGLANPGTLTALLDILEEKEVLHGEQVFKLPLRTVIGTSNLSPSGLMDHFVSENLRESGGPTLDRFTLKIKVPNMLPGGDLEDAMGYAAASGSAEALSVFGGEENIFDADDDRPPLDWSFLGSLAQVMFPPRYDLQPNRDRRYMRSSYLGLLESVVLTYAKRLSEIIKASHEDHYNDPTRMRFPHFPSTILSTRSSLCLHKVNTASALLDVMRSVSGMNANELAYHFSSPMPLGPLSVFRSGTTLTSVDRELVRQRLTTASNGAPQIQITWNGISSSNSADPNNPDDSSALDPFQDIERRFLLDERTLLTDVMEATVNDMLQKSYNAAQISGLLLLDPHQIDDDVQDSFEREYLAK